MDKNDQYNATYSHMIEKILTDIKTQKIAISQWILGFSGIFFVRFFLEALSSPTSTGIVPSDPYTIVHYGLFFLVITLGTAILVGKLTEDYKTSAKFILFGLPVIWLAPLVDIVMSRGAGFKMTYIFDSGSELFKLYTATRTNNSIITANNSNNPSIPAGNNTSTELILDNNILIQ
mgnify:CR=1 FL=1